MRWAPTRPRVRPSRRAKSGLTQKKGSGSRPYFLNPSLFLQAQCCGIDAVADSGRLGAVREDMPEVAAAVRAGHLRPHHAVARVGLFVDGVRGRRRVERGPAAAGVVLRLRAEQLGPAAGATVRPVLEDVVVLAGERGLGALLSKDAVLVGGVGRTARRF